VKTKQFNTIEKLQLASNGYTQFPTLHVFLQQMANLKSLKLSSFWKGPVAQEIHRAVDMSSVSSLRELTVHEKEVLHMLSSYIPNNPTLRVLDHSTENSVAGYRLLCLCVSTFSMLLSVVSSQTIQ
jgi:hypothetical protein